MRKTESSFSKNGTRKKDSKFSSSMYTSSYSKKISMLYLPFLWYTFYMDNFGTVFSWFIALLICIVKINNATTDASLNLERKGSNRMSDTISEPRQPRVDIWDDVFDDHAPSIPGSVSSQISSSRIKTPYFTAKTTTALMFMAEIAR
jgi:hypothetical protein